MRSATFAFNDGGRRLSTRPKQRNDCTVRSLAIVTGLSYDLAFDVLKGAGRKNNGNFDLEKYLREHSKGSFKCQKQGRLLAPVRWKRISDFLAEHHNGRYIIATAKHVAAVVDGVMHDDMPTHHIQDRPVYSWMEYLQNG
jgi:hypothetical protein